MEQLLDISLARARFATIVMSAFAAIALMLAVIGIYGVITYTVEERTREFGIRLALGASRPGILRLVLKHGMKLAGLGITIGFVASLALTRLLAGLLFNTKAADPATMIVSIVVLAVVALMGCFVAARHATGTDPVVALRYE